MKKVLTIISLIFSIQVFSSINEDVDILKEVTGLYPYHYFYECDYGISTCTDGLSRSYVSSPPDFASSSISLYAHRYADYRQKREYDGGGVLFYWDETKGLKLEDYQKFCQLESPSSKNIDFKLVSIDKYNYETKTCNNDLHGCSPVSAPLKLKKQKVRGKKWNKSAKKILNSNNPDIALALKKQKFKSPFFSIQADYSIRENDMPRSNPEPLLESQFYCDIEERAYCLEEDIFCKYDPIKVTQVIRTPVKPWVKDKIKELKTDRREKLTAAFNNLDQYQNYEDMSYFTIGESNLGIKKPKINKDEFETCEEFIPRVLEFYRSVKKIAYAKVNLHFDAERELLTLHLHESGRSNEGRNCSSCNYGAKLKLPTSSYDMESILL